MKVKCMTPVKAITETSCINDQLHSQAMSELQESFQTINYNGLN